MNTINRKHHSLKTDPVPFGETMQGRKLWEIRLNDREFCEGDTVTLHETASSGQEMAAGAELEYTGRSWNGMITWILHGPQYGLAEGWCIFGVVPGFADTAEDIEARLQYQLENSCPSCGGSGHKDDCATDAEPVALSHEVERRALLRSAKQVYPPAGSQGVPEGAKAIFRKVLSRWLAVSVDNPESIDSADQALFKKAEDLLSTSPGNGWVRCEEIEPDAFWDADNSEQNYSDPADLADYASQDLRQGETMTVTVLCAKELPKRTMKIWINSDDEAEFDWISESQTTGESK